MKKKIVVMTFLVLLILILYVVTIHTLIQHTADQETPENADYLIVLGAKVNGKQMSLALYNRAKVALSYLEENPNTKVICTGGQGRGEEITEAEAVSQFLLENNIAENRIIREEKSTSTMENIKFAKSLLEVDNPNVIIVSNDFHLFRAKLIAKRQKLVNVYTLPAKTPEIVKIQLFLREYIAVAKTLVFDW